MLGENSTIEKDANGKPVLKNSEAHLSISHTQQFAAVMFSRNKAVGIDLENINPKVERIAHKFLREDEINAIDEEEKIGKLILYWSAKEALYKLHAKAK